MREAFGLSQGLLRAHLREARKASLLAADADIAAITQLRDAVMAGPAVMARAGNTHSVLNKTVDQFLDGLPLR